MSATRKVLIPSQNAPTTVGTLYQPGAGVTAVIDVMTACNTTVGALNVTVYLVPSAGAVGTGTTLANNVSIAAGATYDFPSIVGHDLESGDRIAVLASASGLTVRASGREFTSG